MLTDFSKFSKETVEISSVTRTRRSIGVCLVEVNPDNNKRSIVSILTWALKSLYVGLSDDGIECCCCLCIVVVGVDSSLDLGGWVASSIARVACLNQHESC